MEGKYPEFYKIPTCSIRLILNHLNFNDMKRISSTSFSLYNVARETKNEMSKIVIHGPISERKLEMLLRWGGEEFQNIELHLSDSIRVYLPYILKQFSENPLMKLTSLEFADDKFNETELLHTFKDQIKNITINGHSSSIKNQVTKLKSEFPNATIYVKLDQTLSNNDSVETLNEINSECEYPIDMNLGEGTRNVAEYNPNRIQDDIYNVRHLKWLNPSPDVLCFKYLLELSMDTMNQKLVKSVIDTNRNTLIKLTLFIFDDFLYRIPCQLEELRVANEATGQPCDVSNLIQDQKNLRELWLHSFSISKNIISTLEKNKFLECIYMYECRLEDPQSQMDLPSVFEIFLVESDIFLLNAFLRNPCHLTHLNVDGIQGDLKDLDPVSVMEKLNMITIKDEMLSNYFCKNLDAPNLVYLDIFQNDRQFISKFEQLELLFIRKILGPTEFREMLEYVKCKLFHLRVTETDFWEIAWNLFDYDGDIKHFTIDIEFHRGKLPFFNKFNSLIGSSTSGLHQLVCEHYKCEKFSLLFNFCRVAYD